MARDTTIPPFLKLNLLQRFTGDGFLKNFDIEFPRGSKFHRRWMQNLSYKSGS